MSAPMINVTLPDGTVLEVPRDSSIGDVAATIGPGLAKAAAPTLLEARISSSLQKDINLLIIDPHVGELWLLFN